MRYLFAILFVLLAPGAASAGVFGFGYFRSDAEIQARANAQAQYSAQQHEYRMTVRGHRHARTMARYGMVPAGYGYFPATTMRPYTRVQTFNRQLYTPIQPQR